MDKKELKILLKPLLEGAPTTGNVEIRLKNPKRSGIITVRDYTDKRGKRRPFLDENGNERVRRIQRTVRLNMEEVNDQLFYNQVVNHPIYIKGSESVLVIINHEAEADEFVENRDMASKADAIIQKLNFAELQDFARVLLITVMPGSSERSLKRALYEKATEDPKLVLNEWNDDRRELKSLIRHGLEKQVFTYRHGKYSHNGELMGTSFDRAVDWLKENEDLVPSLTKEIK